MLTKKIVFTVFVLMIFLVIPVHSLGVVPSRKSIDFEPNLKKTVDLKLSGVEGKVLMYTEGDLSSYIQVPSGYIDVDGSKVVSYDLNLPSDFEEPGNHPGKVIIREVDEGTEGETAVGATVEVVSKINVFVPYTGSHAEAKLHMPRMEEDKKSNFAVEVENMGTEDITDAKVVIDILSPFEDKVATLESEEGRIPKKETEEFIMDWVPEVKPGEYMAKVTLIYDEKNAFDEKNFSIGSPDVNIVSLDAGDYELGGVAKFSILVESQWNKPMEDIYGEVSVKKDDDVYTRTETERKDLPAYGKQTLRAFWETEKSGVGDYKLDALVHFLDNKAENQFDISVEPNEIVVSSPTGEVSKGKSNFLEENFQIIIILIVIIIGMVNIYIFVKMRKRR